MLIEFSVTNFQSITDEITISMEASKKDKSLLKENTFFNEKFKNVLLKSAAIYGPNASGKSNFLRAISLMRHLVKISSHFKANDKIIYYLPSKFNKINQPTKFHIVFIKNLVKYIYGFSYNNEEFANEYLYYYNSNRVSTMFERSSKIDKISNPEKSIYINKTYYYFPINKKRQKIFAENTNRNCLYLSRASEMAFSEVFPVYNWISSMVFFNDQYNDLSYTAIRSVKDEFFKNLLIKSLNVADFGIEDIAVKIQDVSDNLLDVLKEDNLNLNGKKKIDINFKHKGKNFSIQEESSGTIKMFSIMGPIIDILQNGKVLFFDELDVQLHPEMILFILRLFNSSKFNRKNAQLIFTTHNTTLLNKEILRRDQIWFIEKNLETFSSHLFSLLEFKPRKHLNYERNYLEGRYGAIPFINIEGLEEWQTGKKKKGENIVQE